MSIGVIQLYTDGDNFSATWSTSSGMAVSGLMNASVPHAEKAAVWNSKSYCEIPSPLYIPFLSAMTSVRSIS